MSAADINRRLGKLEALHPAEIPARVIRLIVQEGQESEANAIAPSKRPLSSMTPTILLKDGRVAMVLGTPGGSRIFTSVFQVLVDVYYFRLPLKAGSKGEGTQPIRDLDTVRGFLSGIGPVASSDASEVKANRHITRES